MVQIVGGADADPPTGLTNSAPLETIQTVLDEGLYPCGDINNEFDNSMIEHSHMSFTVFGWLKFSVEKFFAILKPRRTLRPKLRTSSAPPRQTTARQALLALNKRNIGGSSLGSPLGFYRFADEAFEKMMDTFAVVDWRSKLRALPPILPNHADLQEWVRFQNSSTTATLDKKDKSTLLEKVKEDIANYEFILKAEPKVSTDTKPYSLYPTVQTVMFHPKHVNAFFGPMVREADRRFRSVLRPNILYNKGKSLNEMEEFLEVNYDRNMGNVIAENDFSDYDRSQLEVAHALDKTMLKWLGLNPDDLETWMLGHYKHRNFNHSIGLSVYLQYQRKSGDVTTAFGNTVLNMTSLAYSLGLSRDEVKCAMFLGDDSWFQLFDSPSLRQRIRECSDKVQIHFNGEAKTAYFETGYFCGLYIIDTTYGVRLVADPVKRAVKLGRWDVKDTSYLYENWLSFKDLMRNYDNEEVQEKLAKAVYERHPKFTYALAKPLIESLNTLRLSYKQFCSFWEPMVTSTYY